MRRYCLPGFGMQLVGELQRQQNNAQFCDTLLKSDGISVPTHSCILAALSPFLSQKLSSSPSPPCGQMREFRLQTVKAQTLLKLVALLYSGEVEVIGSIEQNDLLSAALQFGITDLVGEQRNQGGGGGGEEEGQPQRHCFGSHRELESRKFQDAEVQAEMSGGRDTDSVNETISCSSTGTQTVDACGNTTGSSFTQPDHPSPQAQSLDCLISLQSQIAAPAASSPQEAGVYLQPYESGEVGPVLNDETLGEELGKSADRTSAHVRVGLKNLVQMRRMRQVMETGDTQLSVKVKLRRRTRGDPWEVVSLQDTDETLSVTGITQDNFNHKRPQTDVANSDPPPALVQQTPSPENPILHPAPAKRPDPSPHPETPAVSQLVPGEYITPNGLELVPQPAVPAEDCDEQIEKLLEDIMMGLNILPNLDRDCQKAHSVRLNHDGAAAVCEEPLRENEAPPSRMFTVMSAAERVYFQEFGMQIGHSSTDTAHNQPGCSSLPPVQPSVVRMQPPRSPQHHTSVTSMEQSDGTSHQNVPLSKSLNWPYPEAPGGQNERPPPTYHPTYHESSSQTDPELFPPPNENAAPSLSPVLCMDELRLPRCLSPLAAISRQPTPNSSVSQSNKTQSQPSVNVPPWLAENSRSLQSSLSAMAHTVSLPLDQKQNCVSKARQQHQEPNPQSGTNVEERGATSGSERLKITRQSKSKDDAAALIRRKKLTVHPQEAGSFLVDKHGNVSDDMKAHFFNLSACSVRLSRNNVLAKERQIAASSKISDLGKNNQPSPITERENPKGSVSGAVNAHKTRTDETSSGSSCALESMVKTGDVVSKEGVLKWTPGRLRKRKVEAGPPESSHIQVQIESNLSKEESEQTKRCRKQTSDHTYASPPIKTACAEADGDVIPAERPVAPKVPQIVSLFQKFVRHRHSKTRKSEEGEETNATDTENEEEVTKQTRIGAAGEARVPDVTVDQNHNHIFNESTAAKLQDETDGSTRWESLIESRAVISSDVLAEKGAELAAESEHPQKDPNEAQKPCDDVQTVDHQVSHNNTQLEDRRPLDHSLNHQTPELTAPPLLDAVGFGKSSGVEQETEEEVEVEVLLFSPDQRPQTGECDNGLETMNISPEEEEEEVDVTGDEE